MVDEWLALLPNSKNLLGLRPFCVSLLVLSMSVGFLYQYKQLLGGGAAVFEFCCVMTKKASSSPEEERFATKISFITDSVFCHSVSSSWCLSVLFPALHQSGRFGHQPGHSGHRHHLRLWLEPSQWHTGNIRIRIIICFFNLVSKFESSARRSAEPTESGRPTRWWSTALWRGPAWRSASLRWPRGRWCWPTWWCAQAWDPKLGPWPNRNWTISWSLEQKSSSRMRGKVMTDTAPNENKSQQNTSNSFQNST